MSDDPVVYYIKVGEKLCVTSLTQRKSGSSFPMRSKTSRINESKTDVPEDFDIDMDAPETEKAAAIIQSQFRRFQKKKRDEKS
uniref:Purkinje cell protein 4 n=1 Tax=Nothobranchius furzeri TaxID=105023 RepID=A0A8C6MEK5_NOTFU